MHNLAYAAWAAVASLLGASAPGDVAPIPACEAPSCVEVTHGLFMSRPILAVADGDAVQWRWESGRHLLGDTGGNACVSGALTPESPFVRVAFTIESGSLYAIEKVGNETRSLPCGGAFELPNGAFVLRYACALHAREGAVGIVVVTDD